MSYKWILLSSLPVSLKKKHGLAPAMMAALVCTSSALYTPSALAVGNVNYVDLPESASSTSMVETAKSEKNPLGSVGLESSSFFYKGKGRGTSWTYFTGELNGGFETPKFKGKANLQLYSGISDEPEFGGESKEIYLATNTGLTSGLGEITVGRRYFEWSKVDRNWDMMSLWSPRWTWDQLHPEAIGMTGLFYTFDSDRFHFTLFGSPIAIPERGTAVREENGRIVSSNPLFNQLPTEMNILGSSTHLNYSLKTPPLQEILLRPNFAMKGLYDFENGFWASGAVGVLPVHIIQMAAEPYVNTQQGGNLQVDIRPQFPLRNIYTAEFGYDAPTKDWNLWFSTSYEQPFNFENKSTWLNPIITPTSIVSAGTGVQVTSNFRFNGSVLFIHEQPFTTLSTLGEVNVELPSRFPLKQGFKVGGNWRFNDQTQSNLAWTQDLVEQNHFISADIQHQLSASPVIIGGGADIFVNNSSKGWIGQYYGDDRIRGWLKYVF